MLSEFSPIPGTPDGARCRRWIDMDEPLRHNKIAAFVIGRLGPSEINRLKTQASRLNHHRDHHAPRRVRTVRDAREATLASEQVIERSEFWELSLERTV